MLQRGSFSGERDTGEIDCAGRERDGGEGRVERERGREEKAERERREWRKRRERKQVNDSLDTTDAH